MPNWPFLPRIDGTLRITHLGYCVGSCMHELCWSVWGKRQAANISWLRVSVEIIKSWAFKLCADFIGIWLRIVRLLRGTRFQVHTLPFSHMITIPMHILLGQGWTSTHQCTRWMDNYWIEKKKIHWVLVTMLTTMINIVILWWKI